VEYLIFGTAVIIVLLLLLIFMQKQISGLREQVRKSLENTEQTLAQRFESTGKAVNDVQVNLARLEESNRRIYELGKDISGLQEILRAPKIRGGIGEFLLGDLLEQILPRQHFDLQHTFRSGDKVDAVIRLGDGLVPVDSKFPLENFRRLLQAESDQEKKACRRKFMADVKLHIDAIAGKYILPDEGTFSFALMYVPAENVYYETIVKEQGVEDGKSLAGYAMQRRVIPVSPNTLYLYLQTVILGLRGMQVEKNALEIIAALSRLKVDFDRFAQCFRLIGAHLRRAAGSYDCGERSLGGLESKLDRISSLPAQENGLQPVPGQGQENKKLGQ
jgi:DNA recombination protein RmuC